MSRRLRAISQPEVSHVANRIGPALHAVIRPEKSSGGASDEILNTLLQTMSRQNEKRSRCLIASVVQEAIADSPRVQQTPGSAHTRHLRSQHISLRFKPRSLVATCVYNRVAITRKIDDHAFQPWLQVCTSFGIRNVAKNRTPASPEWRMQNQTISLPDLIFRHAKLRHFACFSGNCRGMAPPRSAPKAMVLGRLHLRSHVFLSSRRRSVHLPPPTSRDPSCISHRKQAGSISVTRS